MEDFLYIVGETDNLWDLAKHYLGSGLRYPELMKHNNLSSSRLVIGQTLRIPAGQKRVSLQTSVLEPTLAKLKKNAAGRSIGEYLDEIMR